MGFPGGVIFLPSSESRRNASFVLQARSLTRRDRFNEARLAHEVNTEAKRKAIMGSQNSLHRAHIDGNKRIEEKSVINGLQVASMGAFLPDS